MAVEALVSRLRSRNVDDAMMHCSALAFSARLGSQVPNVITRLKVLSSISSHCFNLLTLLADGETDGDKMPLALLLTIKLNMSDVVSCSRLRT